MSTDHETAPASGKRGRRRTLPIAAGAGAVFAFTVLAAYSTLGRTQAQLPAPPPIPVVATAAVERLASHDVVVIGTVESLPKVEIRAQIDGTLAGVRIVEGDFVAAGQLLATIDDRIYRAELAGAEAQLQRNEAELSAAEVDLERYRTLVERNAIPRQTLDQHTHRVAQTSRSRWPGCPVPPSVDDKPPAVAK